MIFLALPRQYKHPTLTFWAVFGNFLETFDQKNRVFFGERSLSKVVYIGAEGADGKNLRMVVPNGCHKKYQRGDFLVVEGVESLRKERTSHPPLNPPLVITTSRFRGKGTTDF